MQDQVEFIKINQGFIWRYKLFTEEILGTYRGWHQFEQKRYGNAIIDFDLSPSKHVIHFNSRTEIIKQLEGLSSNISNDTNLEFFLKKKLKASIYFLYAFLGENIPFNEYIYNTLGVNPIIFDENVIKDAFERVEKNLCELGIHFSPEYQEKYRDLCVLKNVDGIKSTTEDSIHRWAKLLSQYIDIPPLVNLNIMFTNVDAYWANWISASIEKGFELKVNLNPRIIYLYGSPSILTATHEYCAHVIQGQIWLQNIINGVLNEACGFTTVHGPEQFAIEGLAETLTFILAKDEDITLHERLSRELIRYRNIVNNNIHCMINTGTPYQEVFLYARKHFPFDQDIRIEDNIRDRSVNPLFRVYQYVYGISQNYFEKILDLPHEKQKSILNTVYSKPVIKQQLDSIIEQ